MSTKTFSHTTMSCVAIASALLISLGCCGGRTATHRYCCHTGKWIPRQPACCSVGPAVAKNSTYFDGCDSGAGGGDQNGFSDADSHRNPMAMIASSEAQPSILNQPESQDSSRVAKQQINTVPEEISAESLAQTVPPAPVETIQAAPVRIEPVPPPAIEVAQKASPQAPIEFEVEVIEKSAPPVVEQLAENGIVENQTALEETIPQDYLVGNERAYGDDDDAWKTAQEDDSNVAGSIVDDFNGRIVLRAKVVQPLIRPLPDDTRVSEGRRLTPAKPVGYPQPTPINVTETYGGSSLRNLAPAPLQQAFRPTNVPQPMLKPASTSAQAWGSEQNFSGLMANPQSSEVNFSTEKSSGSVQQTAQPSGNNVKR
ncbi:MAG: hypothetical protein KF851_02375 [Pirellulaceae bacterium]|nr:hypothetical protein [Pirellulaceae bacterium]